MSPEQMRKKSLAQDEAERHRRHAAVDGMRQPGGSQPYLKCPAIQAEEKRVMAATAKEDADIGGQNASPNDNRY